MWEPAVQIIVREVEGLKVREGGTYTRRERTRERPGRDVDGDQVKVEVACDAG